MNRLILIPAVFLFLFPDPSVPLLLSLPNWYSFQTHPHTSPRYVETDVAVPHWYSQSGEDLHLFNTFFRNQVAGSYLELGALQGEKYSNTFSFHRYLGWRGVLIEASPMSFAKLVQNRPHDICVNAAVCENSTEVHYCEGEEVGGIWEYMDPDFRQLWHPGASVEKNPRTGSPMPLIPCLPLTSILQRIGFLSFDFFSLDVEGAELAVLKSINFSIVHFKVICIETRPRPQQFVDDVKELMLKNGYKWMGLVDRNDWFSK